MAVPKQKSAKARSRHRRETYEKKLHLYNVVKCKNCESNKLAHCVCNVCGFYKNQQVLNS